LNFVYVDDFLESKGLYNPKLEVLIPNATLYKTLLFQPCGDIAVGNYFVKNRDTEIAKLKLKSFFDLAFNKRIDLCITPEYSCPWTVIAELLKGDIFPHENGIWVIGAESILQEEFIEMIEEHNDICWIYEEKLFQNYSSDKFLDPVCYFFQAESKSTNIFKKVVVVQFKTHPMGGADFERDKLLLGDTIYTLRNDENSIFLATIICSDALVFNVNQLKRYLQQSYLIIHIQMNLAPFNLMFSSYRRNYYISSNTSNKEFITLNWAQGTQLCGQDLLYGGSAFYTKSQKLNTKDDRINNNHYKGLYYSFCDNMYAGIFFFNYDEGIYELENTKAIQLLSPPQNQNNTGPIMKNLFIWQNDMWNNTDSVNDNLNDICKEIGADFTVLLDNELAPIDKERLISLSLGFILDREQFDPQKMWPFKIKVGSDCCDINKRLTYFQDPHIETKNEKIGCLMRFAQLYNTIMANGDNIPENIKDLAYNYKLKYIPNENNYSNLFNIYSNSEGTPATIVFLGQTTLSNANAIFDRMCNLFKNSLSDTRLVVWYEDCIGKVIPICKSRRPEITSTTSIENNSFMKRGAR